MIFNYNPMEIPKRHVALVSSPGLGHLIPVIELANRFVIQHNFKATVFAVTTSQTSQILKSSLNSNHSSIIEIPAADITSLITPNDTDFTLKHLSLMMRETKPSILSALSHITPRPSMIIFDLFCGDVLPIAEEFKLPKFVYVASHAWFLSFILHSPVLDKEIEGQYVDQEEPLRIPGCKPVRPEDVVEPMQDRNTENYQACLHLVNTISQGDVFLVNTWEEIQHRELEVLRNMILKVPVYGIGPVVRESESRASSVNESVMGWLDKQPRESVIYVSFGSGGTLSSEQFTEVALGLELSGHRFVWVVRSPSVFVSSDAAFIGRGMDDFRNNDPSSYLPKGFLSRTEKVGLLVPEWGPQVAILSHSCVGGFLSHCGWSSTLESITNGVPMIAWPLYAEQKMNATLLVEELGVAVRPDVLPEKKLVDRTEIACMVRKIMEVDGEGRVNSVRERVKELKHCAMRAVSKGGSSFTALSQVAGQCHVAQESN